MNSLSWLLYIADVIGNLRGLLIFLGVAVSVLIAVTVIHLAVGRMDNTCNSSRHYHPDEYKAWSAVKPFKTLYWLSVPVILFIFAALLPSDRAIYLIAASEAGEVVIANPETLDLLEDLKQIVKSYAKEAVRLGE